MGWSEHYESSFSQVLHSCLIRLCSENLPVEGKVEIDGIVCINVANTEKQIVLKIHDILDKTKSSRNSRNGKSPSAHEGFVPISQQSKYDKGTLSILQQKLRDNVKKEILKNEMQYMTGAHQLNAQGCESDEALIELYKKDFGSSRSGARPPPPLHKMPPRQQPKQEISPKAKLHEGVQSQTSSGSRRKQAKPQMVTHIPEDDEEEAMSTGDMENWYAVGSDSENDTDMSGLSSSMPSTLTMLPYNQNQRPPRQRVPLADEIQQTGLVAPSDYVCRKCNRKFQGFGQLQVHNMEAHRRYTCKQCQTTFSLRCNLRRHERLHEGHKPYQCQWCPKTFSRNGDLKIHEWKHKEAAGAGKFGETDIKQESGAENGIEEGIIVIEPTDVDDNEYMGYSNESMDVQVKANVGSPLDMSKKSGPSAFSAVAPKGNREGSPVVSILGQNVMKTVSKDSSSGGKVETLLDSQHMSDSVISSLYTKYIGNSPKSAILELAQGYEPASSPVGSPMSQTKSSKRSKNYPAVNEALKNWSSAPTSPASHGRNASPSPNAKSIDNSPKSSPKAEPVPRSQHYCLLCKEWWDDFSVYESHCAGVHGRYPCQYCGQTFSNKNNRARHGRSHTGQKQFSCGECGKSFTRSDILREHQIIHTESYHGDQCQYCGTKITTKKADLLAHIKKCIQLNKYSPSMIQAKIEAAAQGVETTLPLEYTPAKFLSTTSLLKQSHNKVSQSEVPDNLEDASTPERVSPSVEVKTSPEPVTNNNKGEKTPPKIRNNDILMAEGGIVEAVPIQGDED